MKALTLTQPWASLVATGDKHVETRSFSLSHRGALAIHAAKTIPSWVDAWVEETVAVQTMLLRAGFDPFDLRGSMPLGAVVATCQVVGCLATEHMDWARTKSKERILGDYAPGRFAYLLEDIMRVEPPVEAKGSLGLWDWDNDAAGIEVMVTGRLF